MCPEPAASGRAREPTGAVPVPQPSLLLADEGGTDVLLIRHGRSADVVPGSPESYDPPLHPLGAAQAAALARRLSGVRLDAIASSDLTRAVQTAATLAQGRRLAVSQHRSLREVHLGQWEGGELRRRAAVRDPEFLAAMESGRWESIPGAERDDDLRARVRATVEALASANPGGRVAVVCHGGAIQALLADVLGARTSFVAAIENTSITRVRLGGARPLVVTIGDCSHLYDPITKL